MPTIAECERIVELGEKATPAPWSIDPASDVETIAIHSPDGDKHVCILQIRDEADEEWRRDIDAEYIVASANAAPDLAKSLLVVAKHLMKPNGLKYMREIGSNELVLLDSDIDELLQAMPKE